MKKIYVFAAPTDDSGSVTGYALCEDGCVITSRKSADATWARVNMTSNYSKDYKNHCPDGYQLEWVDYEMIGTHRGVQEALVLNEMIQSRRMEEVEVM